MRTTKMLVRLLYLLIVSSYLYDSYVKLTYYEAEADLLRSKYQHMQELFGRSFSGRRLPVSAETISKHSEIIIVIFAALQATASLLVMVGEKQFAWTLMLFTLVHTSIVHNPFYKNTTELDKQRAYRYIYTDLCLLCSLMVVLGTKEKAKLVKSKEE